MIPKCIKNKQLESRVTDLENGTKIEKVSLFTANDGYSIAENNIYKQGNHYFGWIIIKKNSGNYTDSAEEVATMQKKIIKQTIFFGLGGLDNYWVRPTGLVYAYVGPDKKLIIRTKDCNYVNLHIDMVTTD